MSTHLAQHSTVYDSEQGAFISEAHKTLATVLHDYNPHFSLVWIPPKDRDATDIKPFAILDSSPGLEPYVMRYLSEAEMQDTSAVLAWVWEGDLSRQRAVDVFQKIETREKAAEALQLRTRQAELEDIIDFGAFMATGGREKKHTFHHNGREYRR